MMRTLDYEAEKNAFRDFYDSNREGLQEALGAFKTLVRSLLLLIPSVSISSIEGRIKDREECISKFNRKYRAILESSKEPYSIKESITDIVGLRVVCLYEDDVERVKEAISAEFDVLGITNKIAQIEGTEDSFGYKGLHLDLKLNEARKGMAEYQIHAEFPFELQIRTVVQDSWSILDHKIKYKKSIPNSLKRRINTLAALFELADREFRAIREATSAEIEKAKKIYPEIEEETRHAEEDGEESEGIKKAVYPRRYDPLNAFNFLRIAQHFFPAFDFEPQKVDGFTQEIVSLKPNISRGKFNFYLRESITNVKRYQAKVESSGEAMNPFAVMRHCLYAGDSKVFSSILTDAARERFDDWLRESKA